MHVLCGCCVEDDHDSKHWFVDVDTACVQFGVLCVTWFRNVHQYIIDELVLGPESDQLILGFSAAVGNTASKDGH